MAEETKVTAEQFLTDPKHAEEKNKLFAILDGYVKVRTEEARAKKKSATLLDSVFNPGSIFGE